MISQLQVNPEAVELKTDNMISRIGDETLLHNMKKR